MKRQVSALEYEALLHLEQMVRVALVNPDAGEFIAVALQALNQVRKDEGIQSGDISIGDQAASADTDVRLVSATAQALLKKGLNS